MKRELRTKYRHEHFQGNRDYHVQLTLAKAHARVAEIMEAKGINQVELMRRMGCSEAHVSRLLDDERNLTLKSYGSIMFALGCEVDFVPHDVGSNYSHVEYSSTQVSSLDSTLLNEHIRVLQSGYASTYQATEISRDNLSNKSDDRLLSTDGPSLVANVRAA